MKQNPDRSKIVVAWDADNISSRPIHADRCLSLRAGPSPLSGMKSLLTTVTSHCPSQHRRPHARGVVPISLKLSFPLVRRTPSIPSFHHTPTETRLATTSAACYLFSLTNLVVLISICELPISTSVYAMPSLQPPFIPNRSFQLEYLIPASSSRVSVVLPDGFLIDD